MQTNINIGANEAFSGVVSLRGVLARVEVQRYARRHARQRQDMLQGSRLPVVIFMMKGRHGRISFIGQLLDAQNVPSAARVAAGAFGFLIFSHAFDGPDS